MPIRGWYQVLPLPLLLGFLTLPATGQQLPWYRQERWQAELSSGALVLELVPLELSADTLVMEVDRVVRAVPLTELTGLRILRSVQKTVGHGARGTSAPSRAATTRCIN